MGIIKQLKDKLGNLIYPQTLTKAVYDESGNRLDNVLSGIGSYSTSEKVIGTWVNGQTLYKKSVLVSSAITLPQDTWVSTGISVGNIGIIASSLSNVTQSFPNKMFYSNNGILNARSDGIASKLEANTYITIEYIKN